MLAGIESVGGCLGQQLVLLGYRLRLAFFQIEFGSLEDFRRAFATGFDKVDGIVDHQRFVSVGCDVDAEFQRVPERQPGFVEPNLADGDLRRRAIASNFSASVCPRLMSVRKA